MMPENTDFNTTMTFEESAAFDMTFSDVETFNTEMNEVVSVVTSDHRELTHRDAAEQHPITSITDLAPELGARPSTALSNQDILNILST